MEDENTDLDVDVTAGPVKQEDFVDFVKNKFSLEIIHNEQTYQLYTERWFKEAVTDFIKKSIELLTSKRATIEKIAKTLSKLPHFLEYKEKIIKSISNYK